MASKKRKTLAEYLDLPWTYTMETWKDHGGYYVVRVNELPGVCSDGTTAEEAFKNVQEPMRLWIEDCLENGREIPEPLTLDDVSGQMSYRPGKIRHYHLAKAAGRRGVSIQKLMDEFIDNQLAAG